MKKYIILAFLALFNLVAFSAAAYTTYDPITGNHYKVKNSYGHTRVYGHNHYTGNSWKTKIDSRGNVRERGMDAYGNRWEYKSSHVHYGRPSVIVYRENRVFRKCHSTRHSHSNRNFAVVSMMW